MLYDLSAINFNCVVGLFHQIKLGKRSLASFLHTLHDLLPRGARRRCQVVKTSPDLLERRRCLHQGFCNATKGIGDYPQCPVEHIAGCDGFQRPP